MFYFYTFRFSCRNLQIFLQLAFWLLWFHPLHPVVAVKNQSELLLNIDGHLPIKLIYGTWKNAENLQEYGEWRSFDGTFDCIEQSATDVIIVKSTDKQIPADFFQRYSDIESLEMSNKHLKSIGTNDLLFAQSLIHLNVSHNQIDHIASYAFEASPKLMEIDLSFNLLYNLNENIFTSYLIKYLYLHNNRLDALNPLWFENLLYLRVLTLNNNRIRTIDWRFLDFWPNINILNLHANEITELTTSTTTNQPRSMQTFTMHNNPVANASHHLIWLDAERIDVHNTSVHILRVTKRMHTILAANNDIHEINLDNLDAPHENAVVTLHLAWNRLQSLENVTHFHRLQYLNVSHNLLSQLDVRVFGGLKDLRQLDLSHNQLKRFDVGQNQRMPHLIALDISFNEILTLELGGIIEQLQTLNIVGNRIKVTDSAFKKNHHKANVNDKDQCSKDSNACGMDRMTTEQLEKTQNIECIKESSGINKGIDDFVHAQFHVMEKNILKKINTQLKYIRQRIKRLEQQLILIAAKKGTIVGDEGAD